MHIAIFCHNYPPHPGGLEVVVRAIAHGLASGDGGHRVTVVSTAWEGARGLTLEGGVDGQVEIHRVPAWHGSEPWGVPYPVPWPGRPLRRALRAARSADLFHAHGSLYATSLLARHLAARAGRPLVVTEHVGWVPYSSRFIQLLQRLAWATVGRWVLGRASRATALNPRVLSWLRRRRPGLEPSLIPNGVDTETFQPLPAEGGRERLRRELGLPAAETLILFVGRESEKKNLGSVVHLRREGEYRLVTCGAAGRQVPSDVLDLGLVPHARMPELYRAVDGMVHPAVGEGFPVAVQEAMASGVPLVVLWDEAYADMLSREAVLACDHGEELGPALERLAADPQLRAELGRRARAHAVTHWGWAGALEAYERIFARLTRGEGRGEA